MDVHPLRGNLFENMVVNDIIKYGTNRGHEEQLFFYRDKSQHEIDVLRVLVDKVEAYEIKSGMTYSTDYFKNLNYIKPLLKDRIVRTMVLYDGEQENLQNDNGYCNFRHLPLE